MLFRLILTPGPNVMDKSRDLVLFDHCILVCLMSPKEQHQQDLIYLHIMPNIRFGVHAKESSMELVLPLVIDSYDLTLLPKCRR